MKSSRTSLIWMTLPILGLLAFGLWRRGNSPKSPPAEPQFGITASIIKEPIYPVDVWAGRDTKINSSYSFQGPLPPVGNFGNGDWLHCLRLVARKDGREQTIFRKGNWVDNTYLRVLPSRMGMWSGGGNGSNGGSDQLNFALRNAPLEWGEIWLCYDVGLRQKTTATDEEIDITTMKWLKARGGIFWATKSLRLRRENEIIKLPKVSTSPLLELRDWRLIQQDGIQQLTIRFRDNGPLPKEKPMNDVVVVSPWNIIDDNGKVFGTTSDSGGQHLAPVSFQQGKGRRICLATLKLPLPLANTTGKLRLQGAVSCNNRWPLMIDIPLLDRTKKVTNGAAHHN